MDSLSFSLSSGSRFQQQQHQLTMLTMLQQQRSTSDYTAAAAAAATSRATTTFQFSTAASDDSSRSISTAIDGGFAAAAAAAADDDDPFWTEEQLAFIESFPREVHIALGFYVAAIGIIGVLANSLVLVVFSRFKRLRTPSNVFIVNLALSDLMASLMHAMSAYSNFNGRWAFGRVGCQLYGMGVGMFGLISILTFSAIACERCLVLTAHPATLDKWRLTRAAAQKVCVLIWLHCLVLCMMPILGWSSYGPEGLLTTCSWDYTTRTTSNRAYYILLLTSGFLVPLILILYSYARIVISVVKTAREIAVVSMAANKSPLGGALRKLRRQMDVRTAQIVVTLILVYIVAWTPYAVVTLIEQFAPINDAALLSPFNNTNVNLIDAAANHSTAAGGGGGGGGGGMINNGSSSNSNGTLATLSSAAAAAAAVASGKVVGPVMTAIPAYFAKTAVVLDPIVYGLSHPQFRSSFRHLLISWGVLTPTGRLAATIGGGGSGNRRRNSSTAAAAAGGGSGRFRRAAGTVMSQRRQHQQQSTNGGNNSFASAAAGGGAGGGNYSVTSNGYDNSRGMTCYPSYMMTTNSVTAAAVTTTAGGRPRRQRRMLRTFHDMTSRGGGGGDDGGASYCDNNSAASAAPYGSDALELCVGVASSILSSGKRQGSVSGGGSQQRESAAAAAVGQSLVNKPTAKTATAAMATGGVITTIDVTASVTVELVNENAIYCQSKV